MKNLLCTWLILLVSGPAFAFDLTVVSYNVESDKDTDPAKVVQDLQRVPGSHIWALVEVNGADLDTYRAAIGQDFALIAGDTGLGSGGRPDDRMAIIFDTNVLEQIGDKEELSAAGGSRHPLLAKFRVIATGDEFWFVVNHLQRGIGAPTTAEWLKAEGAFAPVPPGTSIHHPPWCWHAMRTHSQPLLALYFWSGGNLTQKSEIGAPG